MPTAQETEELVKPALERMIFRPVAQMPLSYQGAHVPRLREDFRQHGFAKGQALARPEFRVVDMPEAVLVTAGQQPRARRAAVGMADVAVGESDARVRQGVDVGRHEILQAMKADIGVPEVVRKDHYKVGRTACAFGRIRRRARARAEQK